MIHSERFKPDQQQCCEKCAFDIGEHADFCTAKDTPAEPPQTGSFLERLHARTKKTLNLRRPPRSPR